MKYLVLLTPILRTENLIYVAQNINDVFKTETEIKPYWVLCFDKYNAKYTELDVKKLEVFCLENNIEYSIHYEGKEGQENYGGDLFNEPLKHIKENKFSNDNPFVIVLDDDNTLSPNLLMFIKEKTTDTDQWWWLNMLDEYGAQRFSRSIDRLAYIKGYGINDGYRIIHRCSSCDPSQILMRLDLLLKNPFKNGRLYDYAFMNDVYKNTNNIDVVKRCQCDFTNIPNSDFYITCYHNGLVTDKMIDNVINDIDSCKYDDSYVRVHVGENNFNIQLTNHELLMFLKEYKGKLKNVKS
jgi:hypothetical protein